MFYGCVLGDRNASSKSVSLKDSEIGSDDFQESRPKPLSNRKTSFFVRDSILEQSDLALESWLDNPDFSKQTQESLKKSNKAHKKDIMSLSGNINKNWASDEFEVSTTNKMVKYTDHYLSRSSIDFESGKIRIETIDKTNPKVALKNAIVTTLLTPKDPRGVDLYSDSEMKFDGKPFLAGLIKDNEGQDILYEWRARKYADFLVQTQAKQRKDTKGNKVYFVDLQMSKNYQALAGQNYQSFAKKYAKLYNLEPALVMAIIHTESNFNPYAMSHVPAYGLMQIVPSTAGADSHELITGKKGIPNKDMLFTAETNIQYGSAYLHILYNRYLKDIKDPKSQEYCVIAAYNTGSGNVLRAFHKDRKQAIVRINSMSSQQVYKHLVGNLAEYEARRYVQKVTNFKKQYIGL